MILQIWQLAECAMIVLWALHRRKRGTQSKLTMFYNNTAAVQNSRDGSMLKKTQFWSNCQPVWPCRQNRIIIILNSLHLLLRHCLTALLIRPKTDMVICFKSLGLATRCTISWKTSVGCDESACCCFFLSCSFTFETEKLKVRTGTHFSWQNSVSYRLFLRTH